MAFDKLKFERASKIKLRRAQLWHVSRYAVPDPKEWRKCWPQIADAVARILAQEFGPNN